MIQAGRPWRLGAGGALLAALVACRPASQTNSPSQASPANAAASLASVQPAGVALLPPMPDPGHDDRPGRAKADDFAAHLDRLQANMTAVDGDFLSRVRTAMQAGAQDDAKRVLADYRAQIAADIAALPAGPRLSGCFAKAAAPNATAEAAVAAMLSDRRDKADDVAGITDRPLTLADFGGLATDIATGAGGADAKTDLAAARASVSVCRDASAETGHRPAPSETHAIAGTTASPSPAPAAPPPKKPGFFQRMFGG